jgi:hypothetical protein
MRKEGEEGREKKEKTEGNINAFVDTCIWSKEKKE